MLALTQINVWHWAGFIVIILVLLGLDLGVFHRFARVVRVKEAVLWTVIWFILALLFARVVAALRGEEEALEFLTGYVIEFSLSMDNVFVMALIFAYFNIAGKDQHRVLYWGILGALIMRGAMIGVGAALIQTVHWIYYLLGGFLVFTGIKWAIVNDDELRPERNLVVRFARKIFPVSNDTSGKFITRVNGRFALTTLALVLLMVETTDLLFAVDSVPAVFAVTQQPFIVFTSNIFAILGLRSLYFVLAGAIKYFRFLKAGLAMVLILIGTKMLTATWYKFPIAISLPTVTGIIGISILASMIAAWREKRGKKTEAVE